MSNVEARVHALINDELFSAYWNAVAYFKTTDLVVCLDTRVEIDPVAVYVREKLVKAEDLDERLKEKLVKPASETASSLSSAETRFWFVPIFKDGDMACTAVHAKRLGPVGRA